MTVDHSPRREAGLLAQIIDGLAARPIVFDALRWILEAGYVGEKAVVRREALSTASRILDFGCGTGALARMFAPDRYVGIDVNPNYLLRAGRHHPRHRFFLMRGERLALRDGAFDAVLISGVVHHVPDETARMMLCEARRVLKPSGRLVMWEDVHTRRKWNLIGKLVHRLDQGDHIRSADEYVRLAQSAFGLIDRYEMSSGVCDYVVLVGQPS